MSLLHERRAYGRCSLDVIFLEDFKKLPSITIWMTQIDFRKDLMKCFQGGVDQWLMTVAWSALQGKVVVSAFDTVSSMEGKGYPHSLWISGGEAWRREGKRRKFSLCTWLPSRDCLRCVISDSMRKLHGHFRSCPYQSARCKTREGRKEKRRNCPYLSYREISFPMWKRLLVTFP